MPCLVNLPDQDYASELCCKSFNASAWLKVSSQKLNIQSTPSWQCCVHLDDETNYGLGSAMNSPSAGALDRHHIILMHTLKHVLPVRWAVNITCHTSPFHSISCTAAVNHCKQWFVRVRKPEKQLKSIPLIKI